MIIPGDDECRRIVLSLVNDPALTEWECDFLDSNLHRTEFTDRQKETLAGLKEKYEI